MIARLSFSLWLVILIFLSTISVTLAQENNGNASDVEEISGSLIRVNQNILTVSTSTGERDVVLPTEVSISKNGQGVNLVDLKPGDRLVLKRQVGGGVLSVSASSAQLINWQAWALPIGALALTISGFYLFYRHKSKQASFLLPSSIVTAHDLRRQKKIKPD